MSKFSVFEQLSLAGKRALVTGSSQGIGRAMVLAFAEAGADVVIHYSGDEEVARETVRECESYGVRVGIVEGDLTVPGAAGEIHRQVVECLGAPDILVLNAAIQSRHSWDSLPDAEAHRQMQVNFFSTLDFIRLCQPAMAERKWGRILTLGSVQQVRPSREMPVYAASKCAQLSLVRNLAREFGQDGITVNNLAPGFMVTARNRDVFSDAERVERMVSRFPIKRAGRPEDCSAIALLLCSEAGSYITGANFFVDGGISL